MSANSETWTQEQYAEYERQLKLINDAYGNSIPQAAQERAAAAAVNNQNKHTL